MIEEGTEGRGGKGGNKRLDQDGGNEQRGDEERPGRPAEGQPPPLGQPSAAGKVISSLVRHAKLTLAEAKAAVIQ